MACSTSIARTGSLRGASNGASLIMWTSSTSLLRASSCRPIRNANIERPSCLYAPMITLHQPWHSTSLSRSPIVIYKKVTNCLDLRCTLEALAFDLFGLESLQLIVGSQSIREAEPRSVSRSLYKQPPPYVDVVHSSHQETPSSTTTPLNRPLHQKTDPT